MLTLRFSNVNLELQLWHSLTCSSATLQEVSADTKPRHIQRHEAAEQHQQRAFMPFTGSYHEAGGSTDMARRYLRLGYRLAC